MTPVDDLTARLRAQMTAYTAQDVGPPDLGQRVQAGLRRRRQRRAGLVAATAVLGVVTSLVVPQDTGETLDRLATPEDRNPC